MISFFQRFFPLMLAIVIFSLLCWGWNYVRRPTTFPFHHIQLTHPLVHIDPKQLRQVAWDNMEGGFFSLKVNQLKDALLRQPWVANVSLRRKWPDTLALSIKEKQAEARWGSNGLISRDGQIFYPPIHAIPTDLPMILAAENQKKAVLRHFQLFMQLLHSLSIKEHKTCELMLKSLKITKRHVYCVTLNNGMHIMIGRQDVLERFQRFVALYPKIIDKHHSDVIYIDLRYPNGLAVKRGPDRIKNACSKMGIRSNS